MLIMLLKNSAMPQLEACIVGCLTAASESTAQSRQCLDPPILSLTRFVTLWHWLSFRTWKT